MDQHCNICKRQLDQQDDPTTADCGGDCLLCMADAGDPECMDAISAIKDRMGKQWLAARRK